jgi:hypothetical protein
MLFQTYPRPILCLRPTNKHGLPLVLLHQIFSQFQQLSRQSLPNSVAGVNALRVASGLCGCMGDGFAKEKARSKAFDDMMGAFLQGADSKTQLFGNKCNGDADRIYRINGRCVIIREDKVEMGAAGDAYTQVARSYDLACERMDDNGVTSDAPVFLLCVMGEYSCSFLLPILMSISRSESNHRWRFQRWRRYGGGAALSHPPDVEGSGQCQREGHAAGRPSARPPHLSRATP